jgi:AraC-like DNA-binding protein
MQHKPALKIDFTVRLNPMIVENYIPAELLRPFIKTFMIIESKEGMLTTVLPHTSQIIAFHFEGQVHSTTVHGRVKIPAFVFSGMRKTASQFNYEKNTGVILAMFKEGGASAFFNEPLNQLFEQMECLSNFCHQNETSILEDRLASSKSNLQRVEIVEQFLLSKLKHNRMDALILSAIQEITIYRGILRVSDVADNFHLSQDAFEKRFRKMVGTSPKQFSSIVRMKSLINDGLQNQSLSELALEAGFYDQSHFNKDFKLFTGQTPTDFFKSPPRW